MKLRVVELLLITTLPALFLASEGFPSLKITVATLIGGTLAAGAANAFNMIIETDIDHLMGRTSKRPIVNHQVTESQALVFAFGITILSLAIFWIFTNELATGLTVGAIAFYVFGYTVGLKRRTSQNIVWGGIAGCMPVLIGWAAVTNSLSWTAFLFFMVVFFWTPPHFWALAIKYKDDYAAAGIPMLPVVAPMKKVAQQIDIKIKQLLHEKDSLQRFNANPKLIQSKNGTINTLSKEKTLHITPLLHFYKILHRFMLSTAK